MSILLLGALSGPAAAEATHKLDLSQVLAAARSNPVIQAAHSDVDAANARIDEVKGAWFPKLEMTSFVAPSPGISCENADCTRTSPEEPSVSLAGVFAGVRLSLVQPVYTFGKLHSGIEAARSGVTVAQQLQRDTARTVAVQAAQTYYDLKYVRELIIVLEDGVQDVDKAQTKVRDKLAAGSGDVTVQDRLRLETLEAEVTSRLADARANEANALAALRGLVGDDEAEIDDVPLEPVDYTLAPTIDSYAATAQESEPRLGAARAAKKGAGALARLERRRFLPDVLVVGGVNVTRAQGVDNPPTAFANDPFNTTGASVALLVRWTLDPAVQRARVSRADADANKASSFEQVVHRVVSFELRRAYNNTKAAQEQMKAMKVGERTTKAWVAAELQADAIGTSAAKDLAEAYLSNLTMRARYLQSVRDWNVATISLDAATGKPADR